MFHRIACRDRDEAAAFIAALSRFLASPSGHTFGVGEELQSYAEETGGVPGAAVGLTDEALRAVIAAFGKPGPDTHTVVDVLPAGMVPILALNTRSPRGKEDVLRALESAFAAAGQ